MNREGDELKTDPLPPVIVIGMHRTGTSLLTRILQSFGFFMGRRSTRNEECPFTNALNAWVFHQANATWERPAGVDTLLSHPRIRPVLTDYLGGITRGPASWRYLGLRRGLKHRSMHGQTRPWGWKDPRNTFTLPIWLDIFPDARVLHITRHGVDVAESLRARHQVACQAAIDRYRNNRHWHLRNPWAPKRRGVAHNAGVDDLHFGLKLWRTYTERAQSHVRSLSHGRALEIRYEDLLHSPEQHLGGVLQFCGITVGPSVITQTARKIRPERAYAFRQSEALREFAHQQAEDLNALGYDP
ncbi:sulfotransferase [Spiribacter sp. 2438]|uniref:sulfotransferase family protein n=1 Tax=Spiribacter sp. 2438 TaxID=2666185 RepID=UPI0012B0D2A1|nr:sulfotransferase [Spiribacter sp. 2438]QGM20938.1 sulfotransferase [Spiribacter sp. 2438]